MVDSLKWTVHRGIRWSDEKGGRTMAQKQRYRFVGRWDGRYHWHRILPVDSRTLEISCAVEWFWGRTIWHARQADAW